VGENTALSRRGCPLRMTGGRATDAFILGDRSMHGSIQSPVRHRMFVAAACAVLAVGTAFVPATTSSADAPATPAAKAADATSASAKPAGAKRSPVVAARRVEFVSAMILWFAVVFVGLGLLVMVMIWGRRLRDSVRRRSPASTVPDPLWYLKKNPKAVAHANQPDRLEDSASGPDAEERPTP
jgi:hypothetical protein